jgi:hypothetical protein
LGIPRNTKRIPESRAMTGDDRDARLAADAVIGFPGSRAAGNRRQIG